MLKWPLRCMILAAAVATVSMPIAHAESPACSDGIDNDDDGAIDFPTDPGCNGAIDAQESDPPAYVSSKPRIAVAIALAGTLNGDLCTAAFTGGDGSLECPGNDVDCETCFSASCGNAVADDSRLAQIRAALAALALRDDVEIALLRTAQSPVTFDCPTAVVSSSSGGWLGESGACKGGLAGGEPVVRFAADNASSLLGYVDGNDNEDTGAPALGADFELRASGDRPLGGLLASIEAFLGEVRYADPALSCRSYRVVLVADGGEQCDGSAMSSASALASAGVAVDAIGFAVDDEDAITELSAIADAGGTGNAIFVGDSSTLESALESVVDLAKLGNLCLFFDGFEANDVLGWSASSL